MSRKAKTMFSSFLDPLEKQSPVFLTTPPEKRKNPFFRELIKIKAV